MLLGLQHDWNTCNDFMFDGRHGVSAYIRKLKDVLMWHFSVWRMDSCIFETFDVLENVSLPK